MKSSFFFLASIVLLLFSCDDQSNVATQTSSYSIEIVDSVRIDRIIGSHSIVAAHPENGNLLLLTKKGDNQMVLVMSQEGEIIKEFEHLSEGPLSAGIILISATFFEDGYALMGVGNIVTYDANFNVKKRIEVPLSLGGILATRSKFLRVIEKDNRPHFLIFYGPKTEKKSTEAEYYNEYNLLSLVDPENETIEPYGYFHDGSMFKSGKAFHFIRTLFEPIGGETKAIVVNDTTLYTFDASGNEIDRVTIPFDDYVLLKGFSLGELGLEEQMKMREVPGAPLGLLHTNGLDIISYRSGIPEQKAIDLFGPNRENYYKEVYERVNPRKVIILKDGRLVSDVLPIPQKLTDLEIVDPFGNIWASQNVNILDEEPEVVTIYKLRIVEN